MTASYTMGGGYIPKEYKSRATHRGAKGTATLPWASSAAVDRDTTGDKSADICGMLLATRTTTNMKWPREQGCVPGALCQVVARRRRERAGAAIEVVPSFALALPQAPVGVALIRIEEVALPWCVSVLLPIGVILCCAPL